MRVIEDTIYLPHACQESHDVKSSNRKAMAATHLLEIRYTLDKLSSAMGTRFVFANHRQAKDTRREDDIRYKRWCASKSIKVRVGSDDCRYCVGGLGANMPGRNISRSSCLSYKWLEEHQNSKVVVSFNGFVLCATPGLIGTSLSASIAS